MEGKLFMINEIIGGVYIGAESDIGAIQKYKSWVPVDARHIISAGYLPEKNLEGCRFLASTIHSLRLIGKKVVVYCDAGMERSVLAVTYYLMVLKGYPYDRAFAIVKEKRACGQYRYQWIKKALGKSVVFGQEVD